MSVSETESPAAADSPAVPGDASISFEQANVIALALLPVALVPIAAHGAVWGMASLGKGFGDVFSLLFFPAFLTAIVVHELLHAAGFLLGGAPRRALRFGIDRKTFSPFAGCTAPLKARVYRFAVVLPALALGVLPLAWGLATGAAWMTIWGAFMLLCAGGDFAALCAMRGVPAAARVLDHPERVGCQVVG
jgi:hypothetical protein